MIHTVGGAVLSLTLAAAATATILFRDDFSAGSNNWSDLPTGANRSVSSQGGKLTISCTNNVSIIKHDVVFSNFSLSVKMRPLQKVYENVGIMFCLNNTISGYCLTQDNLQRFNLVKYSAGMPEGLCLMPCSHITQSENVITVNRFGNRIEMFANGRFVASVTDAEYAGGMIGFFVPEGISVEYDDVVVADQPAAESGGTCFTYDFSDASLGGWYTATEAASAQVTGGALRLVSQANDPNGTMVFYSGNYGNASIRVTASRVDGRDSVGFGIAFCNIHSTGVSSYVIDQEFMFIVNGVGQYGIKGPNSSTYLLKSKLESPMHPAPAKDTLLVVRKAGAYIWYVNNVELDSAIVPDSYFTNAVGLFVFSGATVDFDDMAVGSGDQLVCQVTHLVGRMSQHLFPSLGNAATFLRYDVLGRRLVPCDSRALLRCVVAGTVSPHFGLSVPQSVPEKP